jgi:hypothetical protein
MGNIEIGSETLAKQTKTSEKKRRREKSIAKKNIK